MQKLYVEGGSRLRGTVKIGGAKNSAVALLPATILADSDVVIEGLPDISDIVILSELIEEIGGEVSREGSAITIDPTQMTSMPLPNGEVKKLRASCYCMGAVVGGFCRAVIGLAGGWPMGLRAIAD